MFSKRKVVDRKPSLYAMRSDFCRIFEKDMNHLYLLSYLLTGDRSIAEQCFVGGLHVAQEENQVFKEWAESWARRAIVQNAIRMIHPRKATDDARAASDRGASNAALTEYDEYAGIVDLAAFERFAFVMSVLERYSDQECSLLLGCTRGEVAEARTRAFERLGKFAGLHCKLTSVGPYQKARQDDSESALPSGLAASA